MTEGCSNPREAASLVQSILGPPKSLLSQKKKSQTQNQVFQRNVFLQRIQCEAGKSRQKAGGRDESGLGVTAVFYYKVSAKHGEVMIQQTLSSLSPDFNL